MDGTNAKRPWFLVGPERIEGQRCATRNPPLLFRLFKEFFWLFDAPCSGKARPKKKRW
jgi:hypothetical protein